MTRTVGSTSQTYAMTYNYWNRLRTVSVGDHTLATYTYTSNNGQLNKLLYGNGQYETYSYDELERVTDVRYNNGGNTFDGISYTYTGEGTLGTLTDHANSRVYNYSYDNLYRLTGMSETFTETVNNVSHTHPVQNYSVSYDDANRVSGYSYTLYPNWDGGTNVTRHYSYGYDSGDGSLSSMSSSLASYTLNYDGLKRLSSTVVKTYNNAALMTRSYTYLAGAATNETTTLVSTYKVKKPTSGNFASYTYSYDALGNITGISGSTTASYTYDALNQLTSATQDGVTYSYTYNKAGNILSKTVNNGTPITYTYGDANGWKDLLTGYNGHTISYDAIGNPTTWYDNAQMSWVNGRRLESISAVSGVHSAMSFTYNSDGLRLTKTVGTGNSAVEHRYTWQGGNLISEYWGDGKRLEFYYGPEGSIDSFGYRTSTNGSFYVYYYVKNLQGDVVAIINKDGELRAQYTYDPFGKVLSATGTMADINPIRYRGYYYDAESGFYYLQSRYYDPNLCRFINADGLASTGQGFLGCNMFAYCGNNPTNNIDAAGRLLKKIGVSIEMFLIALNGDGSDQYFTDGSKLVRALKKSKIMKEEIEANIETYKLSGKSELTISGSVSLYGKDNRFDYDLSFSVGKANYSMSISQETRTIGFWFFKTEQTRTVTIIEVYDTYDFDEYRDDNSFGSQLNNLGYSWQEEGLLKPYKWSAVYTIYGKWE